MRKCLLGVFILICAISCQNKKLYEEMAIRAKNQLNSSECKDDFWNIGVISRGKFYFWDNSRNITTILTDSSFVVDTVIYRKVDLFPLTGLQTMKVETMEKIARCFKNLDIKEIRGFYTDSLKYLSCIINDHLTLYYVPDMDKINIERREWFIDNTDKIDEYYFYRIEK